MTFPFFLLSLWLSVALLEFESHSLLLTPKTSLVSVHPVLSSQSSPYPRMTKPQCHKLVSPSLKGEEELFQSQSQVVLPCPLPRAQYPPLCSTMFSSLTNVIFLQPLLSAPSHSIGMLASLKTRDKQPFLYLTVTHETLLYLVHCTGKEKTQEHNGTLLSKNAEIITEKIPETSVWRTHLCKSTGILMLPCLISPQFALTLRSLQQTAHLYLISKFPLFHILS